MMHTLNEYLETYNPNYFQLIIGHHLISVDLSAPGSLFIVKAFREEKFTYRSFENKLLVLSSTED